jgi:hypothetical protein
VRRFRVTCLSSGARAGSIPGGVTHDGSVRMDRFWIDESVGLFSKVWAKKNPIEIELPGSTSGTFCLHAVNNGSWSIPAETKLHVDGAVYLLTWEEIEDLFPVHTQRVKEAQAEAHQPVLEDRFKVGVKADFGKVRGELIPYVASAWAARVAEYGAAKYEVDNWRKLDTPDGRRRLREAISRHLGLMTMGETFDVETKMPHIAAVMCNAAFLLAFDATNPEPGWDPLALSADQVAALRSAAETGKMAKGRPSPMN